MQISRYSLLGSAQMFALMNSFSMISYANRHWARDLNQNPNPATPQENNLIHSYPTLVCPLTLKESIIFKTCNYWP